MFLEDLWLEVKGQSNMAMDGYLLVLQALTRRAEMGTAAKD